MDVPQAAPAAGPQHAAYGPRHSRGDPPAPRPVQSWSAVVTASRVHYDAVIASVGLPEAVQFPDHYPERRFPLSGPRMRIGRRSASREVRPEIDLSGPLADPGVSRMHAILIAQADGSWAVVDPGSENGTTVNDVEILAGEPVLLGDGDSICVGAWTRIRVVAQA
jgi:FHA domain